MTQSAQNKKITKNYKKDPLFINILKRTRYTIIYVENPILSEKPFSEKD